MYQRHKARPANRKNVQVTSLLAKGGLNLKDIPELLNPTYSISNENFFVTNNRGLSKRKGLIKAKEIAGNNPVTLFSYWKGYWIFAYSTILAALNPTTGVVTNIKTNWATSAAFSGCPYGDYFLVGNTGNKIHYVTETGGVFTPVEIAAAPMSGVIVAIGPRLYAGVGNEVYYCSVDDGTNPPFTNWTVATTATAGGKVSFRNAGTVRAICSLGGTIVAFGDTGKYAFKINVENDGTGTVVKIEEVIIDRVDMGGASGAITTPEGLFYTNEAGLWQMTSLGQVDVPYSDQEHLTSILLGSEYFDNIDFSNCDIVFYARFNTILVTCARQSVRNNHIIAYNTETKSFSTFNNWNINRWMTIDGEIYGASSVKTALYQCFKGNSDDGVAISVNYLQELKMGELWTRQMLYGAYIKGGIHQLSEVTVAFDIYNAQGVLETNKLVFTWNNQHSSPLVDGWGSAEWGESSWGGDVDTSDLIENFDGMHQFIRNFQRIRVHITESSKLPLRIDWLQLDAQPKAAIRRRKMTLISTS